MEYVKCTCAICGKDFNVYARDYRVKDGTIKYCGKECMGKGQLKGKIEKCPICGKDFYTTRHKTCSVNCSIEYKKRNRIHKIYKENDYLVMFVNGYNKKGNVKVHRYLMEQHLGRRLSPNEIVHHIDGNKMNNDLCNLQVMTRSEHSKLHRAKELSEGKKLFGQ